MLPEILCISITPYSISATAAVIAFSDITSTTQERRPALTGELRATMTEQRFSDNHIVEANYLAFGVLLHHNISGTPTYAMICDEFIARDG